MNNPPAFPRPSSPAHEYGFHKHQDGMTLRDYFAAKVMQHWLSLPIGSEQLAKAPTEAYKIADAMLKAREQ